MNSVDLEKLKIKREPGRAPQVPKKKWVFKWLGIALIVVALIFVFKLLQDRTIEVETTRVTMAWPSRQFTILDATGYVVAKTRAAVASKGTGRVEWLGVREGDQVDAGTVVARLESEDVEASYRAAQANSEVTKSAIANAQTELNDASDNLRKSEVLLQHGLIAQTTLRDARSRETRARLAVQSAKASHAAALANQDNAKNALDNTQIRAPFDGVVISRSANVGDIVTPLSSAADAKGAVLVMADMNTLEISADVSESALSQISVGQGCEIALDAYPEKRYRGEVASIVPTVNRASATVTANIRILDKDSGILPDMSARVSFLSQPLIEATSAPLIAVNPNALITRDEMHFVAVVETDIVRLVEVKKGPMLGDLQAIMMTAESAENALKVGQSLVVNPSAHLESGQRVSVQE